jgi:hypothetical protein
MTPDKGLAEQAAKAQARASKKIETTDAGSQYRAELLALHEDAANTFEQANAKFLKKVFRITKPTPMQMAMVEDTAMWILADCPGRPTQKAAAKAYRPTDAMAALERRQAAERRRLAREELATKMADARAERRFMLRVSADCTLHELWRVGQEVGINAQKYGRENDKRKVFKVYREADLAKDGIFKSET